MEYIDFKILEIGLPQSLIERGGNPISELISTVDLFNEMIEIYNESSAIERAAVVFIVSFMLLAVVLQ